jgi:FkbM family methyltransferase
MDTTDPLSLWRAESFWTKEVETLAWLECFSQFCSTKVLTLVDVGCNVGVYSLYWLSLNPHSKVIACEPFVKNIELLKSNLELNGMINRATLISVPLYSESVPGNLQVEDLRPGSSGSQFKTLPNGITPGSLNSSTLDSILVENNDCKILKIDVDGLDFEILKGAKASLASKSICSVLIEATEVIQSDIEEFLNRFGFVADRRFNQIESHSDTRRIVAGKSERNRVYTRRRQTSSGL